MKIQTGIVQGDVLSWLLFVVAMMHLNRIRKYAEEATYLQNHKKRLITYLKMDDIKVLAKKEKELETLIRVIKIYNRDIGLEFGIQNEQCAKWKMGKKKEWKWNKYQIRKI